MSDIFIPALLFLAPLMMFGVVGLWLTVRLWWPLMAKLNASGISRAVSRNLLFAGCVNGSEEVTKELNTCRRAYAGLFFVFLVYALFFLGISAVALFVVMFLLNVLTARPYEIPEGTS